MKIKILLFICSFVFLSLWAPNSLAQATLFQLQMQAPMGTLLAAAPNKTTTPPINQDTSQLELEEHLSFFGAGLGVALATVPLSLKGGAYLGTVSNELITSILLPFGAFTLIPAVAVVVAQHYFGKQRKLKTRGWMWPFLASLGVQVAGFASGAIFGVNPHNLDELVAFSFVQALILPTVSTLLFGPQARPQPMAQTPSLLTPTSPTTRIELPSSPVGIRLPIWVSHF